MYNRTILEREVRQVSQGTDLHAFERFLGLAAAQHGQELTKARLARDFGVYQTGLGGCWRACAEAAVRRQPNQTWMLSVKLSRQGSWSSSNADWVISRRIR